MSVAAPSVFAFAEPTYAQLDGLSEPWQPAAVPSPRLLALNEVLCAELGLDPEVLASPGGVAVLGGNAVPAGATPVAMAYSGHQFGGFSPRLGDGRALLLGEVLDVEGRRRDVHLKGSGRTPFARGGDGRAAVGPMLRELLVSEAMHALGVPTTRALAVVATGEDVLREAGPLPGAVLTRVAASHLRVGTFQYAFLRGDPVALRRLVDYAVARHHPAAAEHDDPVLGLFDAVVGAQARLVARWLAVGFIHGVMNTDNVTISGETIDYGPCAFLDAYDPATVFSSIDAGGRYAFGNQMAIMHWDLARFAEALLPLVDAPSQDGRVEALMRVLGTFPPRFAEAHGALLRAKLGLPDGLGHDDALVDDLLALLEAGRVDWTSFFRALGAAARDDDGRVRALLGEAGGPWLARWRDVLDAQDAPAAVLADGMDAVNPVYVPRNHLVEEALDAATAGDLAPATRLLAATTSPFTPRPGLERYAEPAPADFGARYRTFCGT